MRILNACMSLTLALIFTFISCFGFIEGMKDFVNTPNSQIATINDDNYTPYSYSPDDFASKAASHVESQIGSLGAKVSMYKSEEDINKDIEDASKTLSEVTFSATKTITVVTEKEKVPVKNALVRINGVPVWTNATGKAKFTLYDEYVELYVEKLGYNPYIEIIKADDTEKVVYLKKPSDDIEILNVMLEYEGSFFNLMNQPCYVNKNVNESYCELVIQSNVEADEYYLLANDKIVDFSLTGVFEIFDYSSYDTSDEFSVMVTYQGIDSEKYPIRLSVGEPNIDKNMLSTVYANNDVNNGNNINFDGGQFGSLGNLNLDAILKSILEYFIDHVGLCLEQSIDLGNGKSIVFNYSYDPHDGTIQIAIGWEIGAKSSAQFDSVKALNAGISKAKQALASGLNKIGELKGVVIAAKNNAMSAARKLSAYEFNSSEDQKQSLINNTKNELKALSDNISADMKEMQILSRDKSSILKELDVGNRTQMKNFVSALRNMTTASLGIAAIQKYLGATNLLEDMKDLKDFYNKGSVEVGVNFAILGTITINASTGQFESVDVAFIFQFEGSLNFRFPLQLLAVIPTYGFISLGASISFNIPLLVLPLSLSSWLSKFSITTQVELRGGVGAGLYDLIYVEGYIGTGVESVLSTDPYLDGFVSVGYNAKALIWEANWSAKSYFSESNNYPSELKLMSRSSVNLINSDEQLYTNVYQPAKPRFVQVGDQAVLLWISDDVSRNTYNRTKLMFSIFKDGVWSTPQSVYDDGRADFYPDVYTLGTDVHIVWQKSKNIFTENDTVNTMLGAGEVYYAKLDTITGAISTNQLTDNDRMDCAPTFALSSSNDIIVLWRSNSVNDLYATSGINSIFYRQLIGASWTEEKLAYSTSETISNISGGVVNGKLHFSALVSNNTDSYVDNVGKVIAIEAGAQVISEVTQNANKCEFLKLNGNIVLSYYDGENIYYTEDFETSKQLLPETLLVGDSGYNIVDSEERLSIFYSLPNEDGYKQSYVAVYDKSTSTFSKNIKLTNENGIAAHSVGFWDENGTLQYVYMLTDAEDNASICYNSKTLVGDFEIKNCLTVEQIKNGSNLVVFLSIVNTGDLPINQLTITAFNQQQQISLDNTLYTGETVDLELHFTNITLGSASYETVSVVTYFGSTKVEKHYNLQTLLADVELSLSQTLVNNKQHFTVQLTNYGNVDTTITLRCYLNGELYSTKQYTLAAGEVYTEDVVFEEIRKGDYVYFAVESSTAEISYVDNSDGVYSLQDELLPIIFENIYFDMMQNAKNV